MKGSVKLKTAALLSAALFALCSGLSAQEITPGPPLMNDLSKYLEGRWELYSRRTPGSASYLIARYTFTQASPERYIGRGIAAYGGTEQDVRITLNIEQIGSGYKLTGTEVTSPDRPEERINLVLSGLWDPAAEPYFFRLTGYPEKYPGEEDFRKNLELIHKAGTEPWIHLGSTEQAELYTNPEGTAGYLKVNPELWEYFLTPGNQYRINFTLSEILSQLILPEHDFYIFVLDLDSRPDHMAYGIHHTFQRDATGLGEFRDARRPDWFPEGGRLKGSIMLSYRTGISQGPLLHEIVHQWGSGYDELFQPGSNKSHWGAASGYGQLGGFDLDSLQQLGPNLFRADYFSFSANGGNGVRYSELELYIMGLIGADQVPDIWIGEGEKNLRRQRGSDGFAEFSVESHRIISIDDIIDRFGPRLPSYKDSRKEFRVFPVLTGTAPPEDNAQFLDDVYDFTYPGDNHKTLYNFWEATGGRASMLLWPAEPALP